MKQAAPAIEFDGRITGSNDYKDMEGSDLVIITAGIGRKPDMSRSDLVNTNAEIVKNITRQVAKYAPDSKMMIETVLKPPHV
jgi:malate dehydrogenase